MDVTLATTWTTSDPVVAHQSFGAPAGEMQAEVPGEAVLTATYVGLTATLPLLVLESGTYKLSGTIIAADTGSPLARAYVRVLSGTRAGQLAFTDASGRYSLYGLAGSVELKAATPSGFWDAVAQEQITSPASRDFTLTPINADYLTNLSGNWRVTFSLSGKCRSNLPEIAHERQYDATIVQRSAELEVTLLGSHLSQSGTSGRFVIPGSVSGSEVRLRVGWSFVSDEYSDVYAGLVDRLNGSESIEYHGDVRAEVIGEEIRGVLAGVLAYVPNRSGSLPGPSKICYGNDNGFVLQRK